MTLAFNKGTGVLSSQTTIKPPFLHFKDLSKEYTTPNGPYPVLKNVNLEINAEEFICVIGHSGCGKSTLLNMVSGFAKPSSVSQHKLRPGQLG